MSGIRLSEDWDDPGWVRVPRNILRDQSLSFKAMGIVAYLASHKPGFEITREFIYRASDTGKDAVESGLKELREAGYLTVQQARDGRGRLDKGADYILHRLPVKGTHDRSPENPEDGGTVVRETLNPGNPESGKPATKGDSVLRETQDKKRDTGAAAASLASDFEALYDLYGKKVKREDAFRAFKNALKRTDLATIMAAVPAYVASTPDKDFRAHLSTWLNGSRWTDEVASPKQASAGIGGYASMTQLPKDVVNGVLGPDYFTVTAPREVEEGPPEERAAYYERRYALRFEERQEHAWFEMNSRTRQGRDPITNQQTTAAPQRSMWKDPVRDPKTGRAIDMYV